MVAFSSVLKSISEAEGTHFGMSSRQLYRFRLFLETLILGPKFFSSSSFICFLDQGPALP
jgi:hypothetical protein